ncbi:putative endonuclease [Forsythia ovata]|uniref:Endonuclease n=1 Tax=Forsythia ovata TaxID=205694 RepID=A0ABD1WES8_9LAMI
MSILDRVKFLARKINFSEHFQLHCNLMVKSIYHFSANSPSSATKPKGQDNQSAGASSDSSLQQLDEYDLEIEAGSCEQSTYHIDIKRYKKYGKPGRTPKPAVPIAYFGEIKRVKIQDSLKKSLKIEDDFSWKIPTSEVQNLEINTENLDSRAILKYVGGVDVSFSKTDPSIACATLVVLDLNTLQVVYEDFSTVQLDIPYVPGFLAFREAPVLLDLLEKMKKGSLPFYPQILMVDGNGLLHPRGFGLACHLGVLANVPTVGIGKNLHHVDGLNQSRVRQLLEAEGNLSKDVFTLIGDSGSTLGAAIRSTQDALKPIFISVGHRVSLASAIKIVKMSCRFRVPEPIRQADIRSKACLRIHGLS